MLQGKVLITGGAGTLGFNILARAQAEKWDSHFTIFSTDPVKHSRIKSIFPNVHSIVGDIRDATTLYNAMAGKDVVIHAAAVKEIPTGEWNAIDTYEINVGGSLNVANVAVSLGIPKVLGISTDKACHPANNYGATKMIMEKIFQEFARMPFSTKFHLVRYGNVIESSASVLEKWRDAAREFKPIEITDPAMTRFWLSPSQAVDCALESLGLAPSTIFIPRMKSLEIGKMAEYVLGENYEVKRIPIRPGEKMHETLVTKEEAPKTFTTAKGFILPPSTSEAFPYHLHSNDAYTSENAERLTKEEFMEMIDD